MVPNVTPILQRFTTEWAALLQPEAILAACGEVGSVAWRERGLTPVPTIQLCLLQMPHPLPKGGTVEAVSVSQKIPWRLGPRGRRPPFAARSMLPWDTQ